MSPKMRLFIAIPVTLLMAGCTNMKVLLPHQPGVQQATPDVLSAPRKTRPQSPFGNRPVLTVRPEEMVSSRFESPLSRVSDSADGTLYNRDINRINDVANIGTPDGYPPDDATTVTTAEQTWLATEYGVKYLNRMKGTARVYGMLDGLPGARVEAVAGDAEGIWCLVHDREPEFVNTKTIPRLYLCHYDAHTDRWQEQASLSAPYRSSNYTSRLPHDGRCLLSLTKRFVVIVSGVIQSIDDGFAGLYDRQTGKLTTLPWDRNLRADTDAVLPTTLLADDHGVTVGTDHGLLRWDFAHKDWNRFLSDRFIDCGASDVFADSGTVWVASHARLRPQESGLQPKNTLPEWNLTCVRLTSGATVNWSPSGSTAASASPQHPLGSESGFPNLNATEELDHSLPCGLFVNGDSVWTTYRAAATNDSNHTRPGLGWLRLNPTSGAWSESVLSDTDPTLYAPNRQSQNVPPSSARIHRARINFDAVPNGAVRAMALRNTRPLSFDGENRIYDDPEQYSIRRRFPDWLSPGVSPEKDGVPVDALSAFNRPAHSGPATGESTLLGPIPDPDSRDKVWVVYSSGAAVVRCPPANVPLSLQQARHAGNYSDRLEALHDWAGPGSGAQRFAAPILPSDKKPNHPSRFFPPQVMVQQILPIHQSVFCMLAGSDSFAVARLIPATGKWTLYDRAKGLPNLYGPVELIRVGGDGVWIVDTLNVYRYNRATDSWEHIFDQAVGHSTLPTDQEPPTPALLGTIGYSPKFCDVGDETDVLLRRPAGQKGRPDLNRQMLYRFDEHDGHLVATLSCDKIDSGWGEAIAATAKGDLWVGMNRGIFHVRRDAPSETPWQEVSLPIGAFEGQMEAMYPAPNGALWIVSTEYAYLWKHPHD